ncbi:lytic polysaccharide monooxygenase [Streptomyces sp. NPDC003006]
MAFSKYQRIDGPAGYPQAGPADQQIASAGHDDLSKLDEAGAERWHATRVSAGEPLEVRWTIATPRPTLTFSYFLTVPTYTPSQPLSRAVFDEQPFAEIRTEAVHPFTIHDVELPKDRHGRHALLAICTVTDSDTAFYSVADIDIT